MPQSSLRRVAFAAAVIVGAAGAGGCGSRSDALGAGDKINWCYSYFILDSFREPRPDSHDEVLQYAEASIRVIDRVDKRFELPVPKDKELPNGHGPKVAPSALEDYATMRTAFVALRDHVKATTGDGGAVRAAANAFTDDAAYSAAERRATDYFIATCRR
jgi:hypothetical protein